MKISWFKESKLANTYINTCWQIIATTSFYPLLGILIGGTILSVQNGSAMSVSLTLYGIWLALMLPLWLLGNHWVLLIYPLSGPSTILPINHLLGYQVMFFSLLLLVLFLIIQGPRILFSFYFLISGSKNPMQDSQTLTKGRYFYIAWRLGVVIMLSLLAHYSVPVILHFFLGLFTKLYTPTYIYWAEIFRPISNMVVRLVTTVASMKYFYQLWQRLRKF